MTDGDIDSQADALSRPVFGVSPKEDQGVVAQEGFGFQYDCIAKLAIRMLDDESIVSIVCETHEDCVVVFVEHGTELVSCKARSPSKPYTVPALLGDGGLLHLFDRWEHTGRTSRCRLMTDGALADGDAKKLVSCCHSRSPQQLAPWATKLASAFDATPALVTEFLGGLSVQSDDLRPRERLGLITSYNMLQRHLRAAKLNSALHQEYYTRIRETVQHGVGRPLGRCESAQRQPAPPRGGGQGTATSSATRSRLRGGVPLRRPAALGPAGRLTVRARPHPNDAQAGTRGSRPRNRRGRAPGPGVVVRVRGSPARPRSRQCLWL
jgi:hypothetical protein